MNRFVISKPMLAAACALVLLAPAGSTRVMAQQNNDDWCSQDRWGRDRAGVCQVREFTVAATAGTLEVAGTNGGITVEGESRGDVRILAKVVATAETEQRARMIADAVHLNADARPRRGRWSARPAESRGMVGELPHQRAPGAQPVAEDQQRRHHRARSRVQGHVPDEQRRGQADRR